MKSIALLLALATVPFPCHGEDEKSNAALAELRPRMSKFQENLRNIEQLAYNSRLHALRGESEPLPIVASYIDVLKRKLRDQWEEMRRIYASVRSEKRTFYSESLDWHRQDRELAIFLSLEEYDKPTSDFSFPQMIRMWLGRRYGVIRPVLPAMPEKVKTIESLDQTRRVEIQAGDFMVAVMNNGGIVRGRITGWLGDKWVLWEYISHPFARAEHPYFAYRVMSLDDVSRFDIIHKPSELAEFPPALTHLLDWRGEYVPTFVQRGFAERIYLRPADAELMRGLYKGAFSGPLTTVDIRELGRAAFSLRPDYAPLPFGDCATELME